MVVPAPFVTVRLEWPASIRNEAFPVVRILLDRFPRAASLLTRNAPEFSVIPPLKVLVPVRNNCPVPDMVNPDVPARADAIVELPAPRPVGAVPPSVSVLPATGRASGRERVCQYGLIPVVAVSL